MKSRSDGVSCGVGRRLVSGGQQAPFLPVHPTARYYRNTVIKVLQAERPGQFLSLAHRIDRETSGVLLLAKTAEADRKVKRLLEDRDDVGEILSRDCKDGPRRIRHGTDSLRVFHAARSGRALQK